MGLTRGLSAPIGVPVSSIQITVVYTDVVNNTIPPYALYDNENNVLIDDEDNYLVYTP